MKKMKEAAQDKGFIDRTMSSQKDFDAIKYIGKRQTEEYS